MGGRRRTIQELVILVYLFVIRTLFSLALILDIFGTCLTLEKRIVVFLAAKYRLILAIVWLSQLNLCGKRAWVFRFTRCDCLRIVIATRGELLLESAQQGIESQQWRFCSSQIRRRALMLHGPLPLLQEVHLVGIEGR